MKRYILPLVVFATVAAFFAALTSALWPGAANADSVYVTTPGAPLGWFPPVRCYIDSNVTLTSVSTTCDGLTLVAGDRVLANAQTDTTAIGLYIVGTVTTTDAGASVAPLTRAPSAKLSSQLLAGSMVVVTSGTKYAGTLWQLTFSASADASNEAGIIVGNSPLRFVGRSVLMTAPGDAGSPTCMPGEMRAAAGYVYVCTTADHWQRAAIAAW
jgi:hypothetical protein